MFLFQPECHVLLQTWMWICVSFTDTFNFCFTNRSFFSDLLQEYTWKWWFVQILRFKHTNQWVENCGTFMCYKKSRILCDSHHCYQFYICGCLRPYMSVFNAAIKQHTHTQIHTNKAASSVCRARKAEVGGRGTLFQVHFLLGCKWMTCESVCIVVWPVKQLWSTQTKCVSLWKYLLFCTPSCRFTHCLQKIIY